MAMTLREFLQWTKGSYKSIDVRCAAAQVEDHWQNALTIVRFSHKQKTKIEERHQQLLSKWGEVGTSRFKILLSAFDISQLELICDAFSNGKCPAFSATSVEIALGQQVDIMSLKTEHTNVASFVQEREWMALSPMMGNHLNNLYSDSGIKKSLWSIGFVAESTDREAYEVIGEFLEVDYQPGTGFNLLVVAPLYARLEMDFKVESNGCEFKVAFHRCFDKSLEVDVVVREDRQLKYKDGPFSVSAGESEDMDGDLKLWTKRVQVPKLTEMDSVQISLLSINPRLILQSRTRRVRDLLGMKGIDPAQNPLLSALRRFFLGKERIHERDYLTTEDGDRPQDTFEQKIAKLLNLCGYSTARIGHIKELEILKDKTSSSDRGKADILAYSERVNSLLLVECTKEIPRQDDVFKLKTAATVLQHEVFDGTSVRVIPLVFTDVPQFEIKETAGVRLLNSRDIDGIFSDVLMWQKVDQITFKYFLPPPLSTSVDEIANLR